PSTLHCLPSLHDTPTTAIYTLSLHDALPICRRIDAGAKRGKAEHALDFARNGPRAVAFGKSEFFHGGAAHSAAWREQRDCLDQIGFAGTVLTGENHRARAIEQNLRRVIAAEIGQRETADKGGSHDRFLPVMAGLVPAIHVLLFLESKDV